MALTAVPVPEAATVNVAWADSPLPASVAVTVATAPDAVADIAVTMPVFGSTDTAPDESAAYVTGPTGGTLAPAAFNSVYVGFAS